MAWRQRNAGLGRHAPFVQKTAFSAGGVTLDLHQFDDLHITTTATAGFVLGFTGGDDEQRGSVWFRHTAEIAVVVGHSARTEMMNGLITVPGQTFRCRNNSGGDIWLAHFKYQLLTIGGTDYIAIEQVGSTDLDTSHAYYGA